MIIGGGYIAAEQACIYRNFGADVHMFFRGAHILGGQPSALSPQWLPLPLSCCCPHVVMAVSLQTSVSASASVTLLPKCCYGSVIANLSVCLYHFHAIAHMLLWPCRRKHLCRKRPCLAVHSMGVWCMVLPAGSACDAHITHLQISMFCMVCAQRAVHALPRILCLLRW